MQLATRLNRPYISTEGGVVYGEVDIDPGDHGHGTHAERHIALCIDISSSMSGNLVNQGGESDDPPPIEQATEGAKAVLRQLEADDYVGVYAFSDSAQEVFPTTKVGNLDRADAEETIDNLSVKSSTNIEAGLRMSRDGIVNIDAPRTTAKRILLLSDGRPNEGLDTVEELGAMAAEFGKEGISIVAAGLGTHYHEDLIQELAAASQGEWDHLTDPRGIQQFFVDEVFQAGQTVLANPVVELDLAPGVEITEVYRRMPQIQEVDRSSEGGSLTIPIRDLENRELQELVFQLHVPGGELDRSVTIADVTLSSNQQEYASEELTVSYTDEAAKYGEEESIRAKFVHAKGVDAGLDGDTAVGTRLLESVEETFTDPNALRILNVGQTAVSRMSNASNEAERREAMKEGSKTGEADMNLFKS